MSKSLKYEKTDFSIKKGEDTGDKRIAYVFESKDGKVTANFFWIEGNVEVRGLVGKNAVLHMTYPLLNPVGNPRPLPKADEVLASIIKTLARGEYS